MLTATTLPAQLALANEHRFGQRLHGYPSPAQLAVVRAIERAVREGRKTECEAELDHRENKLRSASGSLLDANHAG